MICMTPLPHQVDACSLLCHEEAKHLHVLTVEVWTGDLERMAAKRKRLHSIPVSREYRLPHCMPRQPVGMRGWRSLRPNAERRALQWQIGRCRTHDSGI